MFHKFFTAALLLLFITCWSPTLRAQTPQPKPYESKTVWAITGSDIRERLSILASDSLEGRRTGTEGAEKAARYIASEFERLNLSPLDSSHSYLQPFDFSEHALDSNAKGRTKGDNVIGVIHGDDPAYANEYVIIGAHYDHLGWGDRKFAMDSVHAIHYGADDNASGVAGLLEIAEHLSKERWQTKRSIVFIAFSGEEEGLMGSGYFVDHPLLPLKKVQAMLNMDMIGRMVDSTLIVQGVGSSPTWKDVVGSSPVARELQIKYTATGRGPSDHAKFYSKDIPVLFFFTGFHPDYHRATDTKEKINAQGEAKVAQLVEQIAMTIADQPDRLAFTRVPGDTERTASSWHVYVGGVPDYAYDGDGVRISETTENSPAQKAGLRSGDVIVEFDGTKIKNIYDYTDALAKHHPDDIVKVVVQRGNLTLTIPVMLGRRSASHD